MGKNNKTLIVKIPLKEKHSHSSGFDDAKIRLFFQLKEKN